MKSKKLISTLTVLFVFIILTGCTVGSVPKLDNVTWHMRSVQDVNKNGNIIAYGKHMENAAENIPQIELICKTADGILTIEDKTNGKTYSGTYTLADSIYEAKRYDIVIDDKKGSAVVSQTKYNGRNEATFIITVDSFTVNMYAE